MARKILLADDSVTAQNMGRKILSDAGYDVVTVNNGSAALKRVTEQKPDLIVLDVYMPGYSGLEVCQRLKDSPDTEGIPILLTVGKLEPFKPEEARRVRAEAYIVKPFEASELLSALTRLEDQIVPSRGNGKSEGHGDSETGWKNRLRFPAKKKKEEVEPEPDVDFVGKSALRDTRRGPVPVASPEKSGAAVALPDIPRDITPEELDALSALAAKLDVESAAPQPAAPKEEIRSETRKEFEVAVPAVEESKSSAPAETAQGAGDAKPEIPPVEPIPAVAEAKPSDVAPVRVETLAEAESFPTDKNDEPMFATAAETSDAEKNEVKHAATAAGQVPLAEVTSAAEVHSKAAETRAPENAEIEKAAASPASAEPAKAQTEEPATAASGVQPQQEQERPAPSEEELAAALRLLTPSIADSSAMPSQETLAAAGAALAREVARNASAPGQWMAVAVAVNAEEASRSLESEMFQAMARPAASSDPSTASLAAQPGSAPTISTGDATANSSTAETSSARQESDQKIENTNADDEPAAATFADAMRQEDEPSKNAEPVAKDSGAEGNPAVATETTISTSNAGGEEAMGKEQGKSGKSNWQQSRTATSATKDAPEAAKQAEGAPKTMAAAAADGGRPAPTDPTAIANIVDSVLADLRPKIVEEISKKLAGK